MCQKHIRFSYIWTFLLKMSLLSSVDFVSYTLLISLIFIYTLSITASAASTTATAQNVTVNFTFKNGSSQVGTASVTKNGKVVCISHSFGEAVVTKESTETETGIKTKTCTVCGVTEEEEIPVIVADEKANTSSSAATTNSSKDKSSNGWIIWVILAVAVIGGGAAYFVIKNKKATPVD